MTDAYWDIGTDDSTTPDQRADGLVGEVPDYTRGDEISLEFVFVASARSTGYKTRYKNVREYLDYAGAISVEETANYEPAIFENVPSSASKPSVIVDFDPSPDIDADIDGLWGAIVGGEDTTTIPTSNATLSLDVVVLGELSDYADRQAVKDDLETSIV